MIGARRRRSWRILMIVVVPKITAIFDGHGQGAALEHAAPDLSSRLDRQLLVAADPARSAAAASRRSAAGRAPPKGRPSWRPLRAQAAGRRRPGCARSRSPASPARWPPCWSPACRCCARWTSSRRCSATPCSTKVVEEARDAIREGESIAPAAQALGPVPADRDPHGRGRRALGPARECWRTWPTPTSARSTSRSARLTALLEPLMIVVMGGSVASSCSRS